MTLHSLRFEVLLPPGQMREGEVEAQAKMDRGVDLGVSATQEESKDGRRKEGKSKNRQIQHRTVLNTNENFCANEVSVK